MKIFKAVVFVLFGLMFINAGLDKFFHYMPMQPMEGEMKKIFDAINTLKWIIPLAGFIELIAGILVLFPKTRTLGALMIFPVLIGILCHNATFMPEGLAIAGILFLINIWMIADNWTKIKSILN